MINEKFVYLSLPDSEDKMLNDIEKFLSDNKISGNIKSGFMLCVSEAFTNALIHGNQFDPNKKIIIAYALNQSSIIADVIDEGTGGIEKINKRKQPELMSEGGRGVELIKHYSSSFEISENKKGGLQIKIIFELNRKKVNYP